MPTLQAEKEVSLDDLAIKTETDTPEQQEPGSATKEFDMPSRFEGKSAEDIAKSYLELEKLQSRQGQELGELRRFADQLLQKELQQQPTTSEPTETTVDFDEDNPSDSIKKLIQLELKKALKPVNEQISNVDMTAQRQRLENAHPDWHSISNSEEFKQWVFEDPIRQRLAGSNDFEAANNLLNTWKQLRGINEGTYGDSNESTLNKATLEKGTAGARTSGKPILNKQELMQLRIEDPKRYLALLPEIRQAYEEGRVR